PAYLLASCSEAAAAGMSVTMAQQQQRSGRIAELVHLEDETMGTRQASGGLRSISDDDYKGDGGTRGEQLLKEGRCLSMERPLLPGTPDGDVPELRTLLSHGDVEEQGDIITGSGIQPFVAPSDKESDSEKDTAVSKARGAEGSSRVSAWVDSEGAFYQNTVAVNVKSDEENSDEGTAPGRRASPGTPTLNAVAGRSSGGRHQQWPSNELDTVKEPPLGSGPMGQEEVRAVDDDAASDGG
ncbi:hypothetical protein Agub_g8154, partial [Astrephomene gubernaculifera]